MNTCGFCTKSPHKVIKYLPKYIFYFPSAINYRGNPEYYQFTNIFFRHLLMR